MSNGPWAVKRKALVDHNTIKLTGGLIDDVDWNKEGADRRTSETIDVLLAVWPVPEGHEGRVVDPQTKAQDWWS